MDFYLHLRYSTTVMKKQLKQGFCDLFNWKSLCNTNNAEYPFFHTIGLKHEPLIRAPTSLEVIVKFDPQLK